MADIERGERIKSLRLQKHMTQPAVAEKVGVTLRGYQEWEAGGGIQWENVKRLANVLGVETEFVMAGERGPTPDPFAGQQSELAAILARLGRLEQKLDLVLAMTGADPEKAEDFGMLVRKELERAMGLSAREVGRPPTAAVRGTRVPSPRRAS